MRVLCDPGAKNYPLLAGSAVEVAPLTIRRRFDRDAVACLRSELDAFEPDILQLVQQLGRSERLTCGARAKREDRGVSRQRRQRWRLRSARVAALPEPARRPDRLLRGRGAGFSRDASESQAGVLRRRKLVTVRKGHDLAWYAGPGVSRDALGVPDEAFVVGCVANYRPRKGIEVLLEAVEALADARPIHLVLVGEMAAQPIRRRLAASPLGPRLHVLGPRDDAVSVAAAFDVAVLPAIKREGLPKTVIEAMASGVATVASRVGGVPEIIEDGRSGLIVPPGDAAALSRAIARLHADPELRAALAAAGFARIGEAFRIEDTVRGMARVYADLIAATGRAP